jgi:Subtilase family
MPINCEEHREPRSRLEAQIRLILCGIPGEEECLGGAAVWPPEGAEEGDVDYLYRERALLVRDDDVERVKARLPVREVEHENNVRGLTRLEIVDEKQSVDGLCAQADVIFGEGVVTPDHVFYLVTGTACAAEEAEEVSAGADPDPDVSDERCDGRGVRVAVLDSGWLPVAAEQHYWLGGVDGEPEDPASGDPPRIVAYSGHGTFVAGVARTMAPRADVWVGKTFRKVGAEYESDLVKQVSDVISKQGVHVISLSFGANTRKDIASLGFDVVGQRLQSHPHVAMIAAAGNDGSSRRLWPAAFGWAVGVGALNANWRHRADFSNYGPWVDIYAPGERLVNAFANGEYECTEPPHVGELREFRGMARWSGTSFSTPLVAGLIAARMSETGETGPQAARALLARAQAQAIRGVGPVIFPGQACDDRSEPCRHARCHDCSCPCCARSCRHPGACRLKCSKSSSCRADVAQRSASAATVPG